MYRFIASCTVVFVDEERKAFISGAPVNVLVFNKTPAFSQQQLLHVQKEAVKIHEEMFGKKPLAVHSVHVNSVSFIGESEDDDFFDLAQDQQLIPEPKKPTFKNVNTKPAYLESPFDGY